MKYFIIALIWAGYCILHSYLISTGVTTMMARVLKKYYAFYRLFYIVISVLLLIPVINFAAQADTRVIITYGPVLDIVRFVLMAGSLLMFFWAFFFDYDALSFFGIRQILEFGRKKQTGTTGEIKKKGLLGIMRHPMYLALIVFLWCGTHRVADIVVNSVLTVYIFIGTLLEEKKLVLEFGESYEKYKEEVPMLIPFTKRKRRQ